VQTERLALFVKKGRFSLPLVAVKQARLPLLQLKRSQLKVLKDAQAEAFLFEAIAVTSGGDSLSCHRFRRAWRSYACAFGEPLESGQNTYLAPF